MKWMKSLSAVVLLFLCVEGAGAQVADSVDVTDYDVYLDLSHGKPFKGEAVLTLRLLRPCASIGLSLKGTADSVEVDGVRLATPQLSALPTSGIAAGREFTVRVWYTGSGYVESSGLGGFHFESQMHYNFAASFDEDPHVYGRATFPCHDNIHDKATYTLRVKSKAGWTAECSGVRQSVDTNAAGEELSVWRIAQPVSTYLVGVSQAQWTRIQDSVVSVYGTYPLTLSYLNRRESMVRDAFAELDSVVPMFERCFGPYRWGRIGYIGTTKGSMEHVNNIALTSNFMVSTVERAQTTIAHELGHAWFGNLVTCSTEGDMWINEGGASFTSEVAMEAVLGREASDDYYQRNLEEVLRTVHVAEGYRALHDMSPDYTYGHTTYNKGWMVWHSLRGYLGEERFYSALRLLMERCAFSDIDAARLCDSLSLYTGVNLRPFFDFHVCSPGFVDYNVELQPEGRKENGATVKLMAQGVGTANIPASHRVPVTFYAQPGNDSAQCRRVLAFDGAQGVVSVDLPFAPAYCVLDPDLELSDAATVGVMHTVGYGALQGLPLVHLQAGSAQPLDIYGEHHWGRPFGRMPDNLVRAPNRYWVLRGSWERQDAVKARFHYVRTGFGNTDYENLDRGFYSDAATYDSLVLLCRTSSGDRWRRIPFTRAGNANEGYFVADSLLPGEYCLAVVDSNLLSVGEADLQAPDAGLELFPNPLQPGQPLTVEVEGGRPFTVAIFDAEGRQVWQKTGCVSGQKLSPALAKGTYFVRIENKCVSLHSKLIQL